MTPQLKKEVEALLACKFNSSEIADELNISRRSAQRYIKLVRETIPMFSNSDGSNKILPSSTKKEVPYPTKIINKYKWQTKLELGETEIVGVIGDLHEPFTSEKYLDFLIKTFIKYNVNTIVFIGDLVDMHTLSRHSIEPDAVGVPEEFKLAKANIKKFIDVFPFAKICLGNHDSRLSQRAADNGIPEFCIKSIKELFDIPDTWDIKKTHEINGVTYIHGTQFNSRNILTTASNYTDGSIVFGHQHTLLGISYSNNLFNKESFAMCVGCGIDSSEYAFRYAKNNKFQPILGCGVVINSKEAYAIKMP